MPQDSTPLDKKRKSLERDGRNGYGENDKSSRRSIRRRKEIVNRTFRRATRRTLSEADANADDLDDLNEQINQIERIEWKKVPDKALGDHLLDRRISEIIKRVSAAPDSQEVLGVIETQLLENGAPHQVVQDIMRQLHSVVRARWSTNVPLGTRSKPLNIDYNYAKEIVDILNHNET